MDAFPLDMVLPGDLVPVVEAATYVCVVSAAPPSLPCPSSYSPVSAVSPSSVRMDRRRHCLYCSAQSHGHASMHTAANIPIRPSTSIHPHRRILSQTCFACVDPRRSLRRLRILVCRGPMSMRGVHISAHASMKHVVLRLAIWAMHGISSGSVSWPGQSLSARFPRRIRSARGCWFCEVEARIRSEESNDCITSGVLFAGSSPQVLRTQRSAISIPNGNTCGQVLLLWTSCVSAGAKAQKKTPLPFGICATGKGPSRKSQDGIRIKVCESSRILWRALPAGFVGQSSGGSILGSISASPRLSIFRCVPHRVRQANLIVLKISRLADHRSVRLEACWRGSE